MEPAGLGIDYMSHGQLTQAAAGSAPLAVPPSRRGARSSLEWTLFDRVPHPMRGAAVAASGESTGPDGVSTPRGLVHAWRHGTEQTLCGVLLSKSGLRRFPHVDWVDVQPAAGQDADLVLRVCPRCAAAMGRRNDECRWHRASPPEHGAQDPPSARAGGATAGDSS
jgi:hypothetical protein